MASQRRVRNPEGDRANLNREMVYLWQEVDNECEILESYIAKNPR